MQNFDHSFALQFTSVGKIKAQFKNFIINSLRLIRKSTAYNAETLTC